MKTSFIIVSYLAIGCLLYNGCSEEDYLILRGLREADRGNYHAAIQLYDEALKINPRNEKAFFNRGVVWFDMGKVENAIDDYTKALEIKEFIEAYYNRGIAWSEKGNNDLAISDYTKALQFNPSNSTKAGIYYHRASVKFKKRDYIPAINDYTKCIEIDPNKPELYYSRASVWYETGSLDKAISDYTKAIQIKPTYIQAIFDRANTWHEKREYEAAVIDYERAMELDPENALICNNYSWLLSTCPDGKFRDGAKALKLAKIALKISPQETIYLSSLAAAYAELGNFVEAVLSEKRAILMLKEEDRSLRKNLDIRLASYKSGKPWRENVKREDWMRSYGVKKTKNEKN